MARNWTKKAHCLRFLSIDAVEQARSGHPGLPMGMADVMTVLWHNHMVFNPKDPHWANRDRFVLSAGHGSMLLYSALHLLGYEEVSLEQLKQFRQYAALTAGHPEYHLDAGIETTTGPLGQGLSTAVGIALGEKVLKRTFGSELVDYHVYVMASDGDLMEGISQEAISLAGHWRLNNLIVLYDDNGISIDGPTTLSFSENTAQRFEAAGWQVILVDGHNPTEIDQALTVARQADKPVMIQCRTIIGYGSPHKAGTASVHGAPLGTEETARVRAQLGWHYPPFEIPEALQASWQAAWKRCENQYDTWQTHYNSLSSHIKAEWDRRHGQRIPKAVEQALHALRQTWEMFEREKGQAPARATRQISQEVLDCIVPHMPELIGGSADLTGSNNTQSQHADSIQIPTYEGQYIHYGVREHAMAAIMNGLSLTQAIRPFGGTFLVFSDYLKPALRLSALMHQPVIYVFTHDSIGLGEDGPTHQPIEHLAALRAIPNVHVFRPADSLEVLQAWECALKTTDRPSVIVLTRQKVMELSFHHTRAVERGAYILQDLSNGQRDVTLLATGSEVGLAMNVAHALSEQGIMPAVVSMPCWSLFEQQPKEYRDSVLGQAPRVSIEAASTFGWERYIQGNGFSVGIDHFGASAPYTDLYEIYDLTVEKISRRIHDMLIRTKEAQR